MNQTGEPSLTRHDPRTMFAKAVGLAGDTIAAVKPEQLTASTPCEAFDVRALLEHLVLVLERTAAIGRGDDPFAISVDVTDDRFYDAWMAAAHRVQHAWTDDATLTREVVLPWASFDGAGALASYTAEVTIHTWDLAKATSQSPRWDDEVVAVGAAAYRDVLPDGDREAIFARIAAEMGLTGAETSSPPFRSRVAVSDDASPIEELVAYTGRRP